MMRRKVYRTKHRLTMRFIEKARCPRCRRENGLLPGPFYDRGRVFCQRCSYQFRLVGKAA